MPQLDVSSVFRNPLFTKTVDVTQRLETTGDDGISNIVPRLHQGVTAILQPGIGREMQNLTDFSQVKGAITVYSQFRFSEGGPNRKADIIRWHGTDYVVVKCLDWSDYGAGYMVAVCGQQSLYGNAEPAL